MGLFSSKKNHPQKIDIPADILADVSVNGERKVTQPAPATPPPVSSGTIPVSTSPFLKAKQESISEETKLMTPVKKNEEHMPSSSELTQISSPENSPKPFEFANQSPSERVRFPETPSFKGAPQPQDFKRPDFSQITQDKALTARQKEHLAPLKRQKENSSTQKKTLFSTANLISFGVFILILAFISGGSWYYLNTRNAEEPAPTVSIDALEEMPGEGNTQTKGSILVDQPNYLVLDIETVTEQQIKELLNQEKEKMISEGVTTPVEYLVVDTNQNPVAFSRFAFLVGADTPNDLVSASLEPFSLYLFLDQGALRMALAVTLRPEVGANFPTNKNILPQTLKKFFYPEEYATKDLGALTFSQSSYKTHTISYINIDQPANYAFDMIQQEGILTLANSKNTLRAVIDKRLLVPEE